MLHATFQAPEPNSSEKRRYMNSFYVFLRFKLRTPGAGLFCTRGPPFEIFPKRVANQNTGHIPEGNADQVNKRVRTNEFVQMICRSRGKFVPYLK